MRSQSILPPPPAPQAPSLRWWPIAVRAAPQNPGLEDGPGPQCGGGGPLRFGPQSPLNPWMSPHPQPHGTRPSTRQKSTRPSCRSRGSWGHPGSPGGGGPPERGCGLPEPQWATTAGVDLGQGHGIGGSINIYICIYKYINMYILMFIHAGQFLIYTYSLYIHTISHEIRIDICIYIYIFIYTYICI